MKPSKTLILGTIFSFAAAGVWIASASQAATVTAHSPTGTPSIKSTAPPTAQSATAAVQLNRKPIRIKTIKTKPVQVLSTDSPSSTSQVNEPTHIGGESVWIGQGQQ